MPVFSVRLRIVPQLWATTGPWLNGVMRSGIAGLCASVCFLCGQSPTVLPCRFGFEDALERKLKNDISYRHIDHLFLRITDHVSHLIYYIVFNIGG